MKASAIKWNNKKGNWDTHNIYVFEKTIKTFPSLMYSEALTISKFGIRKLYFDHAINYWLL